MFNPGFGFTGNQGHIHGLTFRGGTDAFHHRPPNQAEELSLYGFNRLHQNGSSCTLAFSFPRAGGFGFRQISIRWADTDFRQGAILVLSKRDFRDKQFGIVETTDRIEDNHPLVGLPQRTVTLSPALHHIGGFIRPRRPLSGFKVSTRNTACPVACPVCLIYIGR